MISKIFITFSLKTMAIKMVLLIPIKQDQPPFLRAYNASPLLVYGLSLTHSIHTCLPIYSLSIANGQVFFSA